jgi:hypothetical protein
MYFCGTIQMDPVITGAIVTGIIGLVAACIAKSRCFMRVLPTEDDSDARYRLQAGCGFTDQVLLPSSSRIESVQLEDNQILFYRKR